ncbi:hypothetical protein JF540_19985 [Salipiger thiooxidans]|uniref:DoxX family membrane protein n=1 Tax=Salipiger thiooxidans TaxID=282683 RepID=UPI001A9058B0|nr:hypothetical protein [Salipiger thiooxidans]MBN8188967.1 hypothetical protein [Salipiger thiooxidans]
MTDVSKFPDLGAASSIVIAALILRISLVGLFLADACRKYFVFTPAGGAGYFRLLGLPGWTADATIAAETLGGGASSCRRGRSSSLKTERPQIRRTSMPCFCSA